MELAFLNTREFNNARVLTEMGRLIVEAGGRVRSGVTVPLQVADSLLGNAAERVEVTHIDYIHFVLDEMYYEFQFAKFPVLGSYRRKTPVVKGQYYFNAPTYVADESVWLRYTATQKRCPQNEVAATALVFLAQLRAERVPMVDIDF